MAENDTSDLSDSRDELEQPRYYSDSSHDEYRMLLAALDLGCYVEEPVYYRPRWYEGDQWVFHFIIKKNPTDPPRMISIGDHPAIESLVLDEGWEVQRYPNPKNSSNHI